ncbi:hypothetical protein [Nostoc sp. CHAB 5715]|nr:hypothetical protein [Nostoc sp. CHAB 5715]MCC5622090.1 hypothetical protein [Nostoc sp. CHAB 5715]
MIEEVIDLLLEILVKTSHSSADKKIVYPLLQDNLDKLNIGIVFDF